MHTFFYLLPSYHLSCSFPTSSSNPSFFNDTSTTKIYTLSLHDALPIWRCCRGCRAGSGRWRRGRLGRPGRSSRSEEHTSELQSPCNLVCRLLLEKKKNILKNKQQKSYHMMVN